MIGAIGKKKKKKKSEVTEGAHCRQESLPRRRVRVAGLKKWNRVCGSIFYCVGDFRMGGGASRQAGRLRILRGFRFKQFTRLQPQRKGEDSMWRRKILSCGE